MPQSKRVLPADVFDALELSAHVLGGIGGRWLEYPLSDDGQPYCIYGQSAFVTDSNDAFENEVARALDKALATFSGDGSGPTVNNNAVEAINRRKGMLSIARVSWREYTKETGLTRGE